MHLIPLTTMKRKYVSHDKLGQMVNIYLIVIKGALGALKARSTPLLLETPRRRVNYVNFYISLKTIF